MNTIRGRVYLNLRQQPNDTYTKLMLEVNNSLHLVRSKLNTNKEKKTTYVRVQPLTRFQILYKCINVWLR